MTEFYSANSTQSKYFKNSSQIQSPLDKISGQLACLAKKTLFINEEGFRGSIGDTEEIKKLRVNLKSELDTIGTSFSNQVLETGRILDRLGKTVNDQEEALVNSLDRRMPDIDKPRLNNLSGRNEDSATFQRMGNSRYVFYLIIAVIVFLFTYFRTTIVIDTYFIMGISLGILILVLMSYFYWK